MSTLEATRRGNNFGKMFNIAWSRVSSGAIWQSALPGMCGIGAFFDAGCRPFVKEKGIIS